MGSTVRFIERDLGQSQWSQTEREKQSIRISVQKRERHRGDRNRRTLSENLVVSVTDSLFLKTPGHCDLTEGGG